MKPLVKICGITNIEDALLLAENGVDFLGFIFFEKSKRNLEILKATEIVNKIKKKFVEKSPLFVGVFVNPDENFVKKVVSFVGIDYIQLHGGESPDFVKRMPLPVIKAFRIQNMNDFNKTSEYNSKYFLFDSFSDKGYGGTGESFNWQLLKKFNEQNRNKKYFLSGGLGPSNIARAILELHPFAVDLSSGLEIYPGKKDKKKIADFFDVLNSVVL